MDSRQGIFALPIAIVFGVGLWMPHEHQPQPDPEATAPTNEAPPSPPTLTGLPDAYKARLRTVRDGIASGDAGRDYKFRDKIVRVAPELTDEELIAALELVDQPNYAIEELCCDETFPLERQVALLSHFVGIQEEDGMNDAIESTAYRFAQIDPAAAREWLRIFEPGIGRGQGLSAIFTQLDQSDPQASVAMYCDLDDLEAEAMIGYGDGPDFQNLSGREFLELTKSFRSDRLREFHLRQTVVWYLAKDDPVDALAYLSSLASDELQAIHGRQLVQAWALSEGSDLPRLIETLTSDLTDEARSPENFYVVAEAWYGRSPTEALAWIGKLDAGADRDAAINGYLRNSLRAAPAESYALALTMADAAERQTTAGGILSAWIDRDADAVRALLPDADIPGDQREKIERKLRSLGPKR
jgi:hypothetical protein